MRGTDALAAIVLAALSDGAHAQSDPTIDRLKVCAQHEGLDRLKCVDEILGNIAESPIAPPVQIPRWIVSETTSPVDYQPQFAASLPASSSTPDAPSVLTIICRARRTELMMSRSRGSKPIADGDVRVSYRNNEGPLIEQRWRSVDNGTSLAFPGDAVRLLRQMPDGSQFLIKVFTANAPPYESTFDLAGLETVRRKVAAACNWSQP